MAKYDEQLDRMNFLMEFRNQPKEVKSNIEYHANGADGKVYGILKEGTKYYIKVTESGKENLAESYDYINGFVNRRENEYKSYNEATKQLELKLMSLNEAYGKKGNVSTVDFNRGEKVLGVLTEEARKELDRMNQILENSCKIGRDCNCDPESKGCAKPEDTEENNKPFDDKVTPDMDYEGSNVDGAKDVKMPDGPEEKADKVDVDIPGESVAVQNPKGGKVVRVNEDEIGFNDELDVDNNFPTIEEPEEENDEVGADVAGIDDENGEEGFDEDELDRLLKEFTEEETDEFTVNEEDAITGPDDVLDKEDNPINGTDNGVDDEKTEEWKRIEEDEEYPAEEEGNEETLKSFKRKGDMPVQTCDRLDESLVKKLTESVYNKLVESKKKTTLEEKIMRIVKEEVTKLDAWGKHPKYGKEPMTHPDAKEVFAGTADRDWNDDSAKGSEQYGKKIGDGAPFDQKVIDLLVDQVMSKIKGN